MRAGVFAKVFGWDIGGAHVKFAAVSEDGELLAVRQLACPIWQDDGLDRLRGLLKDIAREYRVDETMRHAVAVTAELADCFPTRAAGVRTVKNILTRSMRGRWHFYTRRGFIDAAAVEREPLSIASMNWHATASFVAQHAPHGILVDIGSTTTDIVALKDGQPICSAYTDAERLRARELVYSGVARTPLMFVGPELDGRPLIAERFAVTADVYRVLNQLPENADLYPTCDGQDKTPEASARRIARMFGSDIESARIEEGMAEWRDTAEAFATRQCGMMKAAIEHVARRFAIAASAPLVGVGVGRFLLPRIAQSMRRAHYDVGEMLGIDATAVTNVTAVSLAHLHRARQ